MNENDRTHRAFGVGEPAPIIEEQPTPALILERYCDTHTDTTTIDEMRLIWTINSVPGANRLIETFCPISRTYYQCRPSLPDGPEMAIYTSKGNWNVYQALALDGRAVLMGRYLRTDFLS